uniref:Uncharacterized protein n=1 Tax=Amphimedon queenslandica TaxID=400682 RepID=A0A1X7V3V7_AMPQE
ATPHPVTGVTQGNGVVSGAIEDCSRSGEKAVFSETKATGTSSSVLNPVTLEYNLQSDIPLEFGGLQTAPGFYGTSKDRSLLVERSAMY